MQTRRNYVHMHAKILSLCFISYSNFSCHAKFLPKILNILILLGFAWFSGKLLKESGTVHQRSVIFLFDVTSRYAITVFIEQTEKRIAWFDLLCFVWCMDTRNANCEICWKCVMIKISPLAKSIKHKTMFRLMGWSVVDMDLIIVWNCFDKSFDCN